MLLVLLTMLRPKSRPALVPIPVKRHDSKPKRKGD